MSFEIKVPPHGLMGHLDEYIDLYEQTESQLVLKHLSVYAIHDLNKIGKPYTEEDVCDKIDGYILDRTLTKLSEKGFVDVSFNEEGLPEYKISETGKAAVQQIMGDE